MDWLFWVVIRPLFRKQLNEIRADWMVAGMRSTGEPLKKDVVRFVIQNAARH